jgi:YHS domain-containing protein
MRQKSKNSLTITALALVLAASGYLAAMVPAGAGSIVTTTVTDPLTGVAIEGYDPVTYFTDSEPKLGLPDYEYEWGGVPWYFVNAANRDVFIRAPEVYAPQFGGHCEMSLARGYLSDGKPRIYVVIGRKLYFFYSSANRDAFMLSPPQAIKDAETNWPKVAGQLSTN